MDVRINQSVRRRRAHETYLTQPNPKKEDTRDCPYLLGFVVCPLFVWRGLFGLCKTAKELSLTEQAKAAQSRLHQIHADLQKRQNRALHLHEAVEDNIGFPEEEKNSPVDLDPAS